VTDHVLSCGSGRGRLFFYDLRASAYLDVDPAGAGAAAPGPGSATRQFLQCGAGYLNQTDAVYLCVLNCLF
jgi:hypothetical protein